MEKNLLIATLFLIILFLIIEKMPKNNNEANAKTVQAKITDIPLAQVYTDTIDQQRFIASKFSIGNNKFIMFKYGKDFEIIKE